MSEKVQFWVLLTLLLVSAAFLVFVNHYMQNAPLFK
jgi:hypothetical protein